MLEKKSFFRAIKNMRRNFNVSFLLRKFDYDLRDTTYTNEVYKKRF
jgi:hypothetical protein